MPYGMMGQQHDFLMLLNGEIRIGLYVLVVIGLYRFKGFTEWQTLMCWGWIPVIAFSFLTPGVDWVFLVLSLGSAGISLEMPTEIYNRRSRGLVSGKFLITSSISTICWIVYGVWKHVWVIEIVSPCYLATLIATGALWLWFPNKEPIRE